MLAERRISTSSSRGAIVVLTAPSFRTVWKKRTHLGMHGEYVYSVGHKRDLISVRKNVHACRHGQAQACIGGLDFYILRSRAL
jgi:hypothetical protein